MGRGIFFKEVFMRDLPGDDLLNELSEWAERIKTLFTGIGFVFEGIALIKSALMPEDYD